MPTLLNLVLSKRNDCLPDGRLGELGEIELDSEGSHGMQSESKAWSRMIFNKSYTKRLNPYLKLRRQAGVHVAAASDHSTQEGTTNT